MKHKEILRMIEDARSDIMSSQSKLDNLTAFIWENEVLAFFSTRKTISIRKIIGEFKIEYSAAYYLVHNLLEKGLIVPRENGYDYDMVKKQDSHVLCGKPRARTSRRNLS